MCIRIYSEAETLRMYGQSLWSFRVICPQIVHFFGKIIYIIRSVRRYLGPAGNIPMAFPYTTVTRPSNFQGIHAYDEIRKAMPWPVLSQMCIVHRYPMTTQPDLEI